MCEAPAQVAVRRRTRGVRGVGGGGGVGCHGDALELLNYPVGCLTSSMCPPSGMRRWPA